MNRKQPQAFGILLAVQAASMLSAAPLVDGIAIERGHSASSHCDLRLTRLTAHRQWGSALLQGAHGRLTGSWEAGVGFWENDSSSATNDHLLDVGLTPVFRYELTGSPCVTPYVEGGVGIHVLSHSSVSEFRRFGSSFKFGDHMGVGAVLGGSGRYDLSYRFQHLSNAGLFPPNKGINDHLVRLGIRL